MSSKRSSSFRRAIANGRRTLQREILLDETGLGLYKRFVRYVAYEILPCETDRRWYFHQNRLCPPPVFIAIVTIVQVRFRRWRHRRWTEDYSIVAAHWLKYSKNMFCLQYFALVCATNPTTVTLDRSVGSVVRFRPTEKIFCLWSHAFTASSIWAGNPFGSQGLSGCI